VYGRDNQLGVISKFIKSVTQGVPIVINGDGTQTRDFISIDDIITSFDCAIKKIGGKKGDAYNIASGNSISIEELVKMIVDKSDKKIEIIHKEQVKGDIKNSIADVSLASKQLGFVAKHSLKDQLSEIFKNLKQFD
jgi:UDP-glucose 4-epimerase